MEEAFQIEAGQIVEFEVGRVENSIGQMYTLVEPVTPPVLQIEHFGTPKLEPSPTSFANKTTAPSVSSCYVFKSRLQEYAQKAGLTTPVYETIKEGPSHQPFFKSTVVVNNVRYDSLQGFLNRKAAEQSAAEVALVELAKSTDRNFGISQPVHDTGLCKNLLQEYAQKMNYAVPLYDCRKEETQSKPHMYSCVVEIGGIKYIGASASTKKEAEIKAARTALLAIQSLHSASEENTNNSIYTVIPQQKNVPALAITTQETKAALKPKKRNFKRFQWKKKQRPAKNGTSTQGMPANGQGGVELTVAVSSQGTDSGVTLTEPPKLDMSKALVPFVGHCKDVPLTTLDVNP